MAFGQTVTWDGGAGTSNWSDALNWDTDAVPGATNDVVIPSGASTVVDAGFTNSIASLTINGTGSVDLQNDLTVTGSVTVNGTLGSSSSNTIFVGGDFTINDGASIGSPGFFNLEMNGTVAQSIGGTFLSDVLLSNLTIANSGGATVSNSLSLYIGNILTISSGTFSLGNSSITIQQGMVVSGTGSLNAGTSTITFKNGANPTIQSNVSLTFYNLTGDLGAFSPNLNFQSTAGAITFTISNMFNRAGYTVVNLDANSTFSYGTSGKLVYANLQTIMTVGNEWPTTSGNPPAIVEINASGKTIRFAGTRSVNELDLLDGTFQIQNSSDVLTINTKLLRENGTLDNSAGGTINYGSNATLEYFGITATTVGDEWTSTLTPPNVVVNNSGGVTLGSTSLSISNDFYLTNGTVDFSSGGLTLSVGGNVIGGSGQFGTTNSNTLVVTGSGISVTSANATTLHNLNVASSGTVTLQDVTINGTLSITGGGTVTLGKSIGLGTGASIDVSNGTLDLNGKSITYGGSNSLSLSGSSTLLTGGTYLGDFSTVSYATSSTVVFDGGGAESIPGGASITYGNITITNGTTASLQSALQMGSNTTLQVAAGATLKLAGFGLTLDNTQTLSMAGTLETNGSGLTGFGTYAVTGKIIFNGTSADENFPAGLSGNNFDMEVNKTTGNLVVSSAVTIGGNGKTLTLSNGLITYGTGGSLTLAAGTVVSGGTNSSYVDGTVSRVFDSAVDGTTQRTLPVGVGGNYRPVRLDFTGLTGQITITVTQNETAPSGTISAPGVTAFASGLNRYWTISMSGSGSFSSYNLDLVYTGANDPASALTIIQGTNSNDYSTAGSNVTLPASGRIQATFSDFTLTDFAIARTSQTITWDDGAGDGLWSSAANWSGDVVPVNGDNVEINGAYNVTFDGNATGDNFSSLTVAGGATLTLQKGVTVTFGSVSVDATSTLVYDGTTVSVSASNTTFSTGSTVQYNTGTVYADDYSNLILNNSGLLSSETGTITAVNLTMNGTGSFTSSATITATDMTIVSGTVNMGGNSLNVSGTLTISGGILQANALTVGSLSQTAGSLSLAGTGQITTINSLSGGTFEVTGSGTLSVSNAFTNGATLTFNSNGASTLNGVTNNGTINVQSSGNVTFGAYSGSGSINGGSGTGTVSISTFTPSGNVTFGSQTVNISGNIDIQGGTFTPSSNTVFTGTDIQASTGAFSTSAGTIVFSGTSAQTVTGAVSLYSVTVNKSSGSVTLNGDLTVNGTLTLTAGNIVTSSTNILILSDGASVSGGSSASYVDGPMEHQGTTGTKVFPLGKGGDYRPVDVYSISGTSPVIRFELFNTNPNGTPDGTTVVRISSVRYWEGSITSGSISDAQVRLYFGADDGVSSLQTVVVARSSTVSGTYSSLGGSATGSTSDGSVASSAGTGSSLGFFTLGSTTADNSLPVEIASFQAIGEYGKVMLQWITESEINNQGFHVYRATSATGPFERITSSMIPGYQNSNERHEYTYEDKNVQDGQTYYYKLVSYDIDGTVHEFGQIVSAEPKALPKIFALHQNYPNPFNPTTHLHFELPKEAVVSVIIYNSLGQEVKRIIDHQLLSAGVYQNYVWDATDNAGNSVPGGIYFIRMVAHDYNYQKTMKIIYLK
jgi:hypothetical protein